MTTDELVDRFAAALKTKLRAAETKYRWHDGWRHSHNVDEMRLGLHQHVAKGDPLDVAAYAAFLWHHTASTALPGERVLRVGDLSDAALDAFLGAVAEPTPARAGGRLHQQVQGKLDKLGIGRALKGMIAESTPGRLKRIAHQYNLLRNGQRPVPAALSETQFNTLVDRIDAAPTALSEAAISAMLAGMLGEGT